MPEPSGTNASGTNPPRLTDEFERGAAHENKLLRPFIDQLEARLAAAEKELHDERWQHGQASKQAAYLTQLHTNELERAQRLEARLAAAEEENERLRRRAEDLEEGQWPWEWVIATRERERWKDPAGQTETVLLGELRAEARLAAAENVVEAARAVARGPMEPPTWVRRKQRLQNALAAYDAQKENDA